jgi:hypothetical protein
MAEKPVPKENRKANSWYKTGYKAQTNFCHKRKKGYKSCKVVYVDQNKNVDLSKYNYIVCSKACGPAGRWGKGDPMSRTNIVPVKEG